MSIRTYVFCNYYYSLIRNYFILDLTFTVCTVYNISTRITEGRRHRLPNFPNSVEIVALFFTAGLQACDKNENTRVCLMEAFFIYRSIPDASKKSESSITSSGIDRITIAA